MTFANLNHTALALDPDEAKLRRLDALIEQAEADERREAERRAEQERQRREREAARSGLSLDDLRAMHAELAAQVALRQHHLQTTFDRELLTQRRDRLSEELRAQMSTVADTRAEIALIDSKL